MERVNKGKGGAGIRRMPVASGPDHVSREGCDGKGGNPPAQSHERLARLCLSVRFVALHAEYVGGLDLWRVRSKQSIQ